MLEFLSVHLLWWHWIVLGLILLIMEMFTGTFILLGLGLSAVIVGVIDTLYPLSLNGGISIWILFSLLSFLFWFKFMKDNSIEKSGQSNCSLDTLGVVESHIETNGRGRVRFDKPLLGTTLWTATSKENLTPNSRVKIIEIKGQLIEVAKI